MTSIPQVTGKDDHSEGSEKKNKQPKAKGRGWPSGKATPDQLIKPTANSMTARYAESFYASQCVVYLIHSSSNLFALEYKEKNWTFPTDTIWQNLEKEELDVSDIVLRPTHPCNQCYRDLKP